MDSLQKIKLLEAFIIQEIDFFQKMLRDTTQDVYTADQILRRAIDKSLNDIVLACVDLAANLLRIKKRVIPRTYKEIILASHEFVGDLALKIAPLTGCRNETIHEYMKLNWQNVKTVKNGSDDIRKYVSKVVSSATE